MHNGPAPIGAIGAPSKDTSNRLASVHDILKSLGVLKPNGHATEYDAVKDPDITQLKFAAASDIRLMDDQPSGGSCSDSSTLRSSEPPAQDPTLSNSCIMGRHPSTPTKPYTHLATPIELSATGRFLGQTFTQFDLGDNDIVSEFRPVEYLDQSNTTPAMRTLRSDVVAC